MFIFRGIFSCSDNLESDNFINELTGSPKTNQMSNVLIFDSNDQLQEFLDELRDKRETNLTSEVIKEKYALKRGAHFLRSGNMSEDATSFISLLDSLKKKDLTHLTQSDWDIINSDDENLVYEPEDHIIYDTYLSSVLNTKREIQVGDFIYKYAEDGIYYVKSENYALLNTVSSSKNIKDNLDAEINVYAPLADKDEVSALRAASASNPTLDGTSLKLKAGNITISASHVRDLNYRDRGDANSVTNFFTNIFGRDIIAINNFSSNRKMILTCYNQDFLIYKCMGIHVKMQKKVLGIWWNIDAQDLRAGWGAVEIIEKYTTPPYLTAPLPAFTPNLYPELKTWEQKTPVWLSKDFPFCKDFTLFTVPIVHYNVTNKNLNEVYMSGIQSVDKSIKAWMKAYNKSSAPIDKGLAAYSDAYTVNYIIGSDETEPKKRSSIQKNFESDWFGGTYVLGYTTDPYKPEFKSNKFSFTLKGKNSYLGRVIVYGAVKYDNQWRACRIIKSDRNDK
jgi:hypothetical protein